MLRLGCIETGTETNSWQNWKEEAWQRPIGNLNDDSLSQFNVKNCQQRRAVK